MKQYRKRLSENFFSKFSLHKPNTQIDIKNDPIYAHFHNSTKFSKTMKKGLAIWKIPCNLNFHQKPSQPQTHLENTPHAHFHTTYSKLKKFSRLQGLAIWKCQNPDCKAYSPRPLAIWKHAFKLHTSTFSDCKADLPPTLAIWKISRLQGLAIWKCQNPDCKALQSEIVKIPDCKALQSEIMKNPDCKALQSENLRLNPIRAHFKNMRLNFIWAHFQIARATYSQPLQSEKNPDCKALQSEIVKIPDCKALQSEIAKIPDCKADLPSTLAIWKHAFKLHTGTFSDCKALQSEIAKIPDCKALQSENVRIQFARPCNLKMWKSRLQGLLTPNPCNLKTCV